MSLTRRPSPPPASLSGAPASRRPDLLLGLFALLAAAHLAALLGRAETLEHLTKPALMPVLAGYVLLRGGPRPLAAALLFGCGGDTLLQIGGDLVFLAGMGSFAAGHLCYLALFRRSAERRVPLPLVAGYTVAWLGTIVLLWPDLPADMRIPVAGYSLLLAGMALASLRAGLLAAAGGALFLLSDTLIATGIAEWPQAPVPQFWIMLTYLAAQYALAAGVLRSAPKGRGRPEPVTA
ncbi:lysoplasmalogenase [Streptomyces sp. NPDC018031]|uniref:lysoplasmalogenase n=1 Tax=Streptomyces sp. NPDC018031 TaxID=3365033 RepID=UPI00378FE95E